MPKITETKHEHRAITIHAECKALALQVLSKPLTLQIRYPHFLKTFAVKINATTVLPSL